MRAPSSRTRRIATFSAAPVAVLLAGAMVWQGSNAAFTAQTRNTGNSWETGSVTLTDDDGGAAMFQVANIVPDETATKCIAVTATPSVNSKIRLYTTAPLNPGGLEPYVRMSIEQGTGGGFGSCDGFTSADPALVEADQTLASLISTHTSWDSGLLEFSAPGGPSTTTTFKFIYTFDVNALSQNEINALQGKAANINFEWELQND